MRRLSIGTWACTIGPCRNDPAPFEATCQGLATLKFEGLERPAGKKMTGRKGKER
jgi:hypothetical protein